jgi:hypothetical protein
MKNNELTDGLTNEQWKEAQRCFNYQLYHSKETDTLKESAARLIKLIID